MDPLFVTTWYQNIKTLKHSPWSIVEAFTV